MGNKLNTSTPMNVTPIDLLPGPLRKVREQADTELKTLLGKMFDNADDLLFEMADKASSNVDQTLYFDSMREVRIKRQSMEAAFAKSVRDSFRQLYQSGAEEPEAESNHSEVDSLSLVQDDELEESVAVRGMISKVTDRCGEPLQQLVARFDALVRTKTINEQSNPVGPHKLCHAFKSACVELDLHIRAKLVVYKLFDKFVLGNIEPVYQQLNSLLIDEGVLPEIKSGQKVKASRTVVPTGAAGKQSSDVQHQQDTPPQEQAEVFGLLRDLLAEANPDESSPGVAPASNSSAAVVPHQELVGMLSAIQQQGPVEIGNRPVDVRLAVNNMLARQAADQDKTIGRVDNDAINLVSMLFEFILDDHDLPTAMKAMLARLQIPMLKVAVIDKTFFSRGGHPARKLLNELATAAMGWNESSNVSRDPLYQKIQSVIERILNDFVDELSLFDELLEEFTGFIAAEHRKSELIEKRTRDAEEGLEQSQQARAVVAKALNEKAAGKNMPAVVVDLLRDGWSNYMFLVYVKEGVDSDAWAEALVTVDDLIWSVQTELDAERRGRLIKLIPSLLQRLRTGLTSISFNKPKMRQMFKDLEAIHLSQLKPGTADNEQRDNSDKTPVAEPADSSQDAVSAVEPENPSDKRLDSPVIVAREETAVDESLEEVSAGPDDQYTELVNSMSAGTWLEFCESEDKKCRAKLAAIIRSTGKYIFVNRVGMKVAEKYRPALIQEFRRGVVKMLDNALLFDRALESVIQHLREMKE